MAKPALIVGIDPGNTSAVAALNLDKEVVLLESQRDFSDSEMIRKVIDVGRPVVVTSDKESMPSKAAKVAQSVGARKFNPDQDMARSKKNRLGHGDNSHEKDAVAAAVNAYNNLQRKIRKIDSRSDELNLDREELAVEYFSGDLEQDKLKKS